MKNRWQNAMFARGDLLEYEPKIMGHPKGEANPLSLRARWFRCYSIIYARRMGQPTQRATNYTAKSNINTAQIFLYANGQRPNRAMIRQRSRRRQRRGEPHTEHGLGVLLA